MPAISQMIHHSDTSLALLLTLTLEQEHDEREKEEKEVGIRRKRLGAGSESQVRRAVARELLCGSRVSGMRLHMLSRVKLIARCSDARVLRGDLIASRYSGRCPPVCGESVAPALVPLHDMSVEVSAISRTSCLCIHI